MGLRPDIFANGLWNPDYRPNRRRDIRPILERANHYHWVGRHRTATGAWGDAPVPE